MPRNARFTIENGTYHIMMRGNEKREIFHHKDDFEYYLNLLKKNKEYYKLKIYHYILMTNHVHLILNSPTGKILSGFIKRLNVSYTWYYRKKYGGIGHFFQDRFKSFLIQDGKYLLECGRYIETNAVSAGIVEKPEQYEWSSYRVYAFGEVSKLIDLNMEYENLSNDEEIRRRLYREFIEEKVSERRNEERFFKTGAYGSKAFIKEMKNKGLKPAWSHRGQPKKKRLKKELEPSP